MADAKVCPRCGRILEAGILARRDSAGAELALRFVCPTCPRGTNPNECRCPGLEVADGEGKSFLFRGLDKRSGDVWVEER